MTVELIFKMLTRPQDAFKRIRDEKPLYASILYLLLFGVVLYLFTYSSFVYLAKDFLNNIPEELKGMYSTFENFMTVYARSEFMLIFSLLSPFINTFISVAVYNLLAELAIKKSSGIILFMSWTFASSPILLLRFVSVLYTLVFKTSLPAFVSIVFIVWEVYLYVMAIRSTYEARTNIASLIFLLPIIFGVLSLFYLAYFISSINYVSFLIRSLI
jgi:hypothetical protein